MSDLIPKARIPDVENFGLYAEHDQACAIYWEEGEKAVFDCQQGVFEPSWRARQEGWFLVCVAPGWRRRLVKMIAGTGENGYE